MSSIMMYGTVMIATLVSKVAAFPALYDSEAMGCEIPAMEFSGHGAPEVDPLVTVMITQDGTAVMEFVAGEMYDIETPAYNGDSVNVWIHASAGDMLPVDATHDQATACTQAAHSMQNPAPTHAFIWTAPATTDTVTISIAQAAGSSDYYHTATTDLPGGGAATPAAATPAAASPAAPPAAAPPGIPPLAAAGATDDPVEDAEGDEQEGTETSASVAAATGTLAAAAAAIAALAM